MKKTYLILTVAAVLLIGGYLVYARNKPELAEDTATAPTSDLTQINNNQNNDEKETAVKSYKFPGILPDEQIKGKKVLLGTTKGVIEFELYNDKAPKTVSNFVYLANEGYYNGLVFHRVVPEFVIQGGDPTGTGSGGPGYKFEDEPVVGPYKKGTVAMANSGPDTNGSQFFICLEDLPSLPPQYNLFGQVTAGFDVISKIAVGDRMTYVRIENK